MRNGLVTALVAAACAAAPPLPRAEILTSGGMTATFRVELAADDAARARGLSGRETLAPDAGMAFVWDADTDVRFHMDGVRFALDIAFADASGRIVRILRMEPCVSTPCPTYDPGTTVRTALEVGAGALARAGVREGDVLRIVR